MSRGVETERRRIERVEQALIEEAGLPPEEARALVEAAQRERERHGCVVPPGLQSLERYTRGLDD